MNHQIEPKKVNPHWTPKHNNGTFF